jgi:TRAP-type C4-dicarboxylate transport system permease small subunit
MKESLRNMTGVVIRALGTFSGLMFFIMMLLISSDVVGRYFFSAPIDGALELTEMMLVVAVFLGISFTQYRGTHIRVSILHSRLPEKWQKALNILAVFLGMVISAVMIWKTAAYAFDLMVSHKTPWAGPQIPLCIPAAAVPIGFLLVLLHLCFYSIDTILHEKDTEKK